MKCELMNILVCPVCKGKLDLTVIREVDGEIEQGSLHCANDNETYPIEDAIPNLIPSSQIT